MAKDVARFEKVSFDTFKAAMQHYYPKVDWDDEELFKYYSRVELPVRKTTGSVGYDFMAPFSFVLSPGTKICIPTGIRVVMEKEDYGLFMLPRSSSIRTSIRLSNTVGVIDTDYYKSDNEGHVLIFLEMPVAGKPTNLIRRFGQLLNKDNNSYQFNAGEGFVQGILIETGKATSEIVPEEDRNGGFGSTDKNESEENPSENEQPPTVPATPLESAKVDYYKAICKTIHMINDELAKDKNADIHLSPVIVARFDIKEELQEHLKMLELPVNLPIENKFNYGKIILDDGNDVRIMFTNLPNTMEKISVYLFPDDPTPVRHFRFSDCFADGLENKENDYFYKTVDDEGRTGYFMKEFGKDEVKKLIMKEDVSGDNTSGEETTDKDDTNSGTGNGDDTDNSATDNKGEDEEKIDKEPPDGETGNETIGGEDGIWDD